MLLTQAQLKEEELKYLQISGFGLAEYGDSNDTSKMFKDLSTYTTIKELERLKVTKIQSSGLSSNANIKAIINVLLKTIYENQTKQDLLDFFKSSFYNSKLDLTEIKHHPLQLTNAQMKKLVVQFFYSLSYSQFRDKVDSKLTKYPIIMEILVLYIRTILSQLGLNKAENYLFRLPTNQVFGLVTEYFDLNCKEQGNLYLFFEDRMFILEDEHNQILFGQYIQNQNQLKSNEGYRFQAIQDLQDSDDNPDSEDIQNEWSQHGTEGFSRSLELRGMVSESIMFDQEASTPFFIFDQESCTSFQSSRQPSLIGDQENQKSGANKAQKDVSLLKQMDRMTGSQQMSLGGILAMKKTIMENQIKNKNSTEEEGVFRHGYGFGMTLQSPITLDSPHTLQIPSDRNFGQQVEHLQKIKQMKKSKSQKRSKTMPAQSHNDLQKHQISSLSHKNVQISSNVSHNMLVLQKQGCECATIKKQKLKISSCLYEINMSYNHHYYPDFSKKNNHVYQIPSTNSIFNKSNLVFTRGKSISGLQKKLNEQIAPANDAFKFQQSGRIIPKVYNDQSFSSYSVRAVANPESDTFSRRQFSPLSNLDRPLSPFGGSKSITTASSPKITFNYKNPLKYSTCMKKVIQKVQQKK